MRAIDEETASGWGQSGVSLTGLLIGAALLVGAACGAGGERWEPDSGSTGGGSHARDAGLDAPTARDAGGGVDAGESPIDEGPADAGHPDGEGPVDAGTDAPEGCGEGTWSTVDPSTKGPFAVVTENNVGPMAGVTENGTQPRFVMIRPSNLKKCHPVIAWGNGYGDNPPTYMVLLQQLASHGFVVVASLSHYVSKGDPPPMKVGIDWVLEQNSDPQSALYQRIDPTRVGATGHSAGGFATSQLGSDPRIKTVATICGAGSNRSLHGPALLLCGGKDTVATCTGMQAAFDGITQPVMLANQLSATHGSWIGSIKDPFMIAVTGWMRLHLMGDAAQRDMFYGPACELCTNSRVWKVQQKSLDK